MPFQTCLPTCYALAIPVYCYIFNVFYYLFVSFFCNFCVKVLGMQFHMEGSFPQNAVQWSTYRFNVLLTRSSILYKSQYICYYSKSIVQSTFHIAGQ